MTVCDDCDGVFGGGWWHQNNRHNRHAPSRTELEWGLGGLFHRQPYIHFGSAYRMSGGACQDFLVKHS